MKKLSFIWWGGLLSAISAGAAEAPTSESVTTAASQAAIRWKDKIFDFVMERGPSVAGAAVVLVAGWIAAGMVAKFLDRALQRKQLEPPIRMLISRIVFILVLGFAAIIALDTAGFKMTTLIAGISVAGVGVGLAMQGVLGNLVAGLLIIFTKPYRVGEYIDIIGEYGQVANIELFNTVLTHSDRSRIIIPNRKIIGEVLHNYGTVRQLELTVGIAYDTKIPEAVAAVNEVLRGNARVLKEIAPYVGITALADSSINLAVKPWVQVNDFGAAQLEIYQAIVEKFRERNISIPFPQREIRVLNGHTGTAISAA